jgi:hypothetical protein
MGNKYQLIWLGLKTNFPSSAYPAAQQKNKHFSVC